MALLPHFSIEYIGEGVVDERSHHSKKTDEGNQKLIKDEIESNPGVYERIVHEETTFSDLIEAKEATAIKVFNPSNLWNINFPTFPKPIALWNNLDHQAYSDLEDSFGIFTLFQNFLLCNEEVFKKRLVGNVSLSSLQLFNIQKNLLIAFYSFSLSLSRCGCQSNGHQKAERYPIDRRRIESDPGRSHQTATDINGRQRGEGVRGLDRPAEKEDS